MNIELRNVRLVHGHNDSTPYVGKLYIDGKHIANCENDGWGGPDNIQPISKEARIILNRAEEYAKTLPSVESFGMTLEMNLELLIGELLEDFLKKKNDAKLIKKTLKKIILMAPNKQSYIEFGWKVDIATMKEKWPKQLADQLAKLKKDYPEHTLVNTNL